MHIFCRNVQLKPILGIFFVLEETTIAKHVVRNRPGLDSEPHYPDTGLRERDFDFP